MAVRLRELTAVMVRAMFRSHAGDGGTQVAPIERMADPMTCRRASADTRAVVPAVLGHRPAPAAK
jgi:hypothetical protein